MTDRRTDGWTAAFNKVPAVTLVFWIIKIVATTVGETAADVLSTTFHLGLVVTSVVMAVLLVLALLMQFRARTYVPTFYWITVVFISVVGTLISDNLVDNLGVPLLTTTFIFAAALTAVFIWWYLSEHTLSVHAIYTTRRELFYWGAILFTFSLGTSGGDLISEKFGLGYSLALGLFAAGIAIVYALYRLHVINGVLAFWAAYILTRPLGASAGDLLTQAPSDGGLGMGRSPSVDASPTVDQRGAHRPQGGSGPIYREADARRSRTDRQDARPAVLHVSRGTANAASPRGHR